MNVTLPSGAVINDVPDGTTRKDLLDKLARAGGYEEDVRQMQAASIVRPIGKEGFKAAAEDVARNTAPGGIDALQPVAKFAQGVGETFDRYALGAKGLATDLTPEDKERLEQNRIMTEAGGAPAALGQAAGDVAITAPAFAAGGAAGPVARAALPRTMQLATRAAESLPGRVATSVAPGAALGALSSPEDRAAGAGYGAAGGAAGAGLNRAVGGALRPFVSREGQELIEQGIQPTPGQAIGGMTGRMEEKLASLPIVGDAIKRSRERAVREYNEALTGRVSQEVTGAQGLPRAAGRALGAPGDEAQLALRRQIGDVYERVLGQVPQLRIERPWIEHEVANIASDPALALSDQTAQRLFSYVEKNLLARGADISGDVAKRLESDMGKAVARYTSGTTGEERAFGEALSRLHEAWRQGIMRSLPPQARGELANANAAWRAFRPLDEAAAAAPSQLRGGVHTPRVLRSALARGDKSQSDNVLRELQERPVAAAQSPYEYVASMSRAGRTLGDTVPDSGTPARLLATAGLGTALATEPVSTLAAGAGAYAAYSRMGAQALTQGLLPATREAISTYLERQGVPRAAIPMLTQRTLELYARTAGRPPQQQQGN